MRSFNSQEENKVRLLTNHSVELAYLELTETGLKKSICDATAMVRQYLKEYGVHDYETQQQGEAGKILLEASILTETRIIETKASLYRPVTKHGDPRIWFYGLKEFASMGDIISVIAHAGKLYIFNLTATDLNSVLSLKKGPLFDLITEIDRSENYIADELLFKLRRIAMQGPIKSLSASDTGIGRTLESALGIKMNCDKTPDYKGIELKSFRSSRNNRKTLFAQVPDWGLSKFKSSREILDAFGYMRGDVKKLYCTVNAKARNSQGLILRLDEEYEKLVENGNNSEIGDFACWQMKTLKNRLLEKHRETFWIEAKSTIIGGDEYLEYKKVERTRKPVASQLPLLIEQSVITLDHLIKQKPEGYATEKGPLFKIKSGALNLLFPESLFYNLAE
jgi:hypothetical protein